jgi:hypothetical protein
MGLIANLKAALTFSRVVERLKEAQMKGGLQVAVFGIGTAVATGVVAKVTEVCPTLIPNIWPIVTAGVMGGVALWLRSPKDAPKP